MRSTSPRKRRRKATRRRNALQSLTSNTVAFSTLLGRFALRILFLKEDHLWVAGIKVQEVNSASLSPCSLLLCSPSTQERSRARCRFRLAGQSRGHQQNLIDSDLEVFWLRL